LTTFYREINLLLVLATNGISSGSAQKMMAPSTAACSAWRHARESIAQQCHVSVLSFELSSTVPYLAIERSIAPSLLPYNHLSTFIVYV